MRSRIFIVYVLLLHVALAVVFLSSSFPGRLLLKVFPHDDELPTHPCYPGMLEVQARMAPLIPDGSVLFLGDSLMQSLCVAAITRNGVNMGIGGETVRGLLHRVVGIRAFHRAKGVFVLVGHNDLERGNVSDFKATYLNILVAIPSHVPIAACAIPPVDERIVTHATNARIQAYNIAIKDICTSRPGCIFIPQPAGMTDESGNLIATFYDDGVHLNAAGYRLLVEAMRKAPFL